MLPTTTSATNATRNGGSSGSPRALLAACAPAVPRERQRHHDRQQHRHAQHLRQYRVVADVGRDAVACADDLRDVVDGASEEYARLRARRGPSSLDERRVEDHRERRQRGDAGDREDRARAPDCSSRGSTAAIAMAAEAPQIAVAPPVRTPKRHGCGRKHRAATAPNAMVHATAAIMQRAGAPAERADLLERDTRAEQGHAEAQHAARGEVDAWLRVAFHRDRVERHAEQQRVQQRRTAAVVGDERRRNRNDDREQERRASFLERHCAHSRRRVSASAVPRHAGTAVSSRMNDSARGHAP